MKRRILLVEDNVQLLRVLKLAFRSAGFAVATAADGITALKKVRSVEPDVVVLDLVLPEMDGFAVCEVLRQSPPTAMLPVVVITGLTSQLARFAGLGAGATAFVSKPFSPSELVSKVEELLSASDPVPGAEPQSRGEAAVGNASGETRSQRLLRGELW